MLLPIPDIIFEDWLSVQAVIERIRFNLSTVSKQTYAGLTLTDLIANRLIATDSGKTFESIEDLTAWIVGTTNQIIVTDNGDGTLTLSTPQDIHTDATPEFAGWVIKDSSDDIVALLSDEEFYITLYEVAEIVTGNPIGLALVLTYNLE